MKFKIIYLALIWEYRNKKLTGSLNEYHLIPVCSTYVTKNPTLVLSEVLCTLLLFIVIQ